MDNDSLYEVSLVNIPFKQAQGLYRFLVDLPDVEGFLGDDGAVWSGQIAGQHHGRNRAVNLRPMPTHEEATRERDARVVVATIIRDFHGNCSPALQVRLDKLGERLGVDLWAAKHASR